MDVRLEDGNLGRAAVPSGASTGMKEAWAAVGGLLMILLGVETWRQAWATTAQGADVLAFLLALMLLSALRDVSGFFEWAAIHSAQLAHGNSQVLRP